MAVFGAGETHRLLRGVQAVFLVFRFLETNAGEGPAALPLGDRVVSGEHAGLLGLLVEGSSVKL